jgi:hypothetical protein
MDMTKVRQHVTMAKSSNSKRKFFTYKFFFVKQQENPVSLRSVVSCAVPVGNVTWMLFQKGRSSKLRLRRGVVQAAHSRNNPQVKCAGDCCA